MPDFFPTIESLRPKLDAFEQVHHRVRWTSSPELFTSIDRKKVALGDLFSARVTCHVENFCQIYTVGLEELFGRSPVMHKFLEIWDLEECNHAHALRDWMIACGLPEERIYPELANARLRPFKPLWDEPAHVVAYVYLQELLTGTYYKLWLDKAQDPSLKALLKRIIVDEYRHFDWYKTVLKAFMKQDREFTVRAGAEVAAEFVMPGAQIIPHYDDLTDHLATYVDFSTMSILKATTTILGTFGLIDGAKLLAGSSYLRHYRERDKLPPKSDEELRLSAEHVAAFEAPLREVLAGIPQLA